MASRIEQAVNSVDKLMCVGIEIRNNSKVTLNKPEVYVHGGVLQSPPALIIDPGMNGICIFAKYSFSLCGVEGLLSYKFKGKRLCLMFSNPFWSAVHNRKFNLMIDDESKLIDERLFHEMGLETGNSNFRIVSESSITSTSVKGGGVEVTATMSSAVKSVIKIEIRDV